MLFYRPIMGSGLNKRPLYVSSGVIKTPHSSQSFCIVSAKTRLSTQYITVLEQDSAMTFDKINLLVSFKADKIV